MRVLGSLGAEVGGTPVGLGAPRQRAVLALLTAARGSVVPVDRMTDALWRGEPPAKATVSLHTYVSHLRRTLEPGRPPRTPATVLVTAPPGYVLRLPQDAVDAWRFEASVGRARRAPAEEARALLAEALGWWQGPAYAEHAHESWAASEVARLTELRAEARELAAAADLRTGRAPEAVPAAEVLVRESPLREEGWRLLALAHWACGRQSDALSSLRRAAHILREELGCDPGPALTELERAVLTQRLDLLHTAVPLPTPPPVPTPAPAAPPTAKPTQPPPAPASAPPAPGSAPPAVGSAAPASGSVAPPVGSVASAPGSVAPVPGSATPAVGSAVPASGSVAPAPGSVASVLGSAALPVGSVASAPGSVAPVPGSATPAVGSAVPASGSVAPAPGSVASVPGSAALPVGSVASAPGSVAPVPGSATPAVGSAVPASAPPAPGSATPAVGSAAPASGSVASAPGSVAPVSGLAALPVGSVAVASGSAASVLGSAVPAPGMAASVVGSVSSVPDSVASAHGSVASAPGPDMAGPGVGGPADSRPAVPGGPESATHLPAPNSPEPRPGSAPFVGRAGELRALGAVAREARCGGGVVLVSGEAGAGKSALLERLVGVLRGDGWKVVVGRCPEYEGAPPAWAWVEALGALARDLPPARPGELDVLLREPANTAAATRDEATAGRFRMHRAFAAWLRAAATAAPLAVVLEDLHRADGETLALLEAAAAVTGVALLTVASYRPAEVGEHLVKTLAQLAPGAPHRIALRGLPPADVATVVHAVCGEPVDATTVAALAERTGGNPFYVLESARLLAGEGALVAVSEVPQGVRDVLRRRLALLPEGARAAVRLTAAVGLEAEVALLVDAADADEDEVLEGLDAALAADLLTEPGPGRVRFVHALVRDTVYTDLSGVRRSRLHGRIARALRHHRPDDLAALAHHFARSGSPADAPLAVDYALRAAEVAERRYAHDIAVDLLQQAIDVHTTAVHDPHGRLERTVGLLVRLLGAQIRAGSTDAARRTRQQAVELAEQADRGDLVAAVYGAWTEPTGWRSRLEGPYDRTSLARLERLAADPGLDDATRGRVLHVLVDAVAAEDAPRARDAARTQLRLARAGGDPRLLAAALMTSARLLPNEVQGTARTPLVAELRELARAHDLPAYRWICEHLDGMTAAALNDPETVRRRTADGLALARRYRMLWAQGLGAAASAMLANVGGRFDAAEAGYAEADGLLQRVGAHHATGLRTLGLITVRVAQGRITEVERMIRAVYDFAGPSVGVLLALVLTRLGRPDEASEVRFPTEPVSDHLYGIELDFRSQLAVLQDDHTTAAALIERMLPFREQLAGAAGTAYASRPVAHALGDLYRLLGEDRSAAEHYALAARTARAWGSPHLTADAERAAAELETARAGRRTIVT
ncbi:BTAD domain-containing putative transcriptional regulator [Streptomyces sp. T028]|uniref:BTAD domain-containing putative transcriptional regulator n=1 Tax=Streptomyces sp. T028 TaxID=3394379 RepID=UPI003A874126